MKTLVSEASNGPFTEDPPMMADAGIPQHTAFLYDSTKGGYREILLSQNGDVSISNESPAAKKLVAWPSVLDTLPIRIIYY